MPPGIRVHMPNQSSVVVAWHCKLMVLKPPNLAALACMLLHLVNGSVLAEERPSVRSLMEVRKQNVVIQNWDLSCGAAALATILNYQHGESVSEREIATRMMSREEYLANPMLVRLRQGFSLLDMKRFVDDRGYNGLVDLGYKKHFRVHHGQNEFARGKSHINGIESFWGYAKTRLSRFRGVNKKSFLLHLKECEFRFNNRGENLYLLILEILRKNPLF